MNTTPKRHNDDDEDDEPRGDWVLALFVCLFSTDLRFVVEVEGKPKADWWPTSARHQAYRWNSYHAARKFQRAHPHLRGYVILNLTEIEQRYREHKVAEEEWIHRD
jgi:hypothetical protein